jgi:hypothetical protein
MVVYIHTYNAARRPLCFWVIIRPALYAHMYTGPGIPVSFAAPRAVANGSCPHPPESAYPITRIYLTDDPVPATLPMSDRCAQSVCHCLC